MLTRFISFFLENRLLTAILLAGILLGGIVTAPFGWNTVLPSDPVPVDAIPDIGENQQIVYAEWPGRSPQDIEDQITYPLTSYLLGIPGVKTIRSSTMFGLSSIYIIFNEDIEFYWSRSRILEKLNSIPAGLLPEGITPALGPDATALGQVFWYTLEGRDSDGNVTGGWDLQDIRSVQDFYVKYGLNAVDGVSEVASIGGFVREYQVDVDPSVLKSYNIPLSKVVQAIGNSNAEVGANTIEINQAEYLVRGLGYVKSIEDLENAVVTVNNYVPVRIRDIGRVSVGPSTRRGILDKGGAEVVGGVVVARYGSNPMQVLANIHEKIAEISQGMPEKVLSDGTVSKLTIIPFYDRSGLIHETLGTLEEALTLEVLISILVVLLMVYNIRTSILISGLLPVAILMVFIAMRYTGVDANIVALTGIAIAIGTMVDLGIILVENILKHLRNKTLAVKEAILAGSTEVASAIVTAVATTIVSFLPVFSLQGAEGKLFGPLAFTKTYALLAALFITLVILPTIALWLFRLNLRRDSFYMHGLTILTGLLAGFFGMILPALALFIIGIAGLLNTYLNIHEIQVHPRASRLLGLVPVLVTACYVLYLLTENWMPLGPENSVYLNILFVFVMVGVILGLFRAIEYSYASMLRWCLANKALFFTIPAVFMISGLLIWQGFERVSFGLLADTSISNRLSALFPGLGKEFMPTLDEGSFLLMPTSMPHSGIEYNRDVVGKLDMLVRNIPEVALAVGKMGRAETALDPAPISMFENLINYKPEYILDKHGHRQRFKTDNAGRFMLDNGGSLTNTEAIAAGILPEQLIADADGQYFRNWREHIHRPEDIWDEIIRYAHLPGVTSAPKLQPIETRLIMLQTGMRAPMGIKVYGPDLETIESFGRQLEGLLKEVDGVKPASVFADRIVGKPYLNLEIKRDELARYGISVRDVQDIIQSAIGGTEVTTTVEGRERYKVRVRYPRELRNDPETLGKIFIATPANIQIQLSDIVDITFTRGPQVIKSENTFLVGYVLFDKQADAAEVDVVENARNYIEKAISSGQLRVPPRVSYEFSGNYENQVRASARLQIVVPAVLIIVFLILYMQFRSATTALMIFTGIAMAFSGGFFLLWLYGKDWFMDITLLGTNFRELFQIRPVNLSVAVWVGFIALFGIATDDGVLIGTYLKQSFKGKVPATVKEIHSAVTHAGMKRIKPALMTIATTLIALLPILTSSGRGSDIMIPMAIPTFGGMTIAIITVFLVPVLYSWREELKLKKS